MAIGPQPKNGNIVRGLKWKPKKKQQQPFPLRHKPKSFALEEDKEIIPGANIKGPDAYDHRAGLKLGLTRWMKNCEAEGREVWIITVMFRSHEAVDPTIRQIAMIVEEYYSALGTKFYRRPNSKPRTDLPLLVAKVETASLKQAAIPRSPQRKNLRVHLRPKAGEFGTHVHGFLAAPPKSKTPCDFSVAHQWALSKTKARWSFLSRIELERPDCIESWSGYMHKQRGREGAHLLEDFDIEHPRTVEEMQNRDDVLRRPRPTNVGNRKRRHNLTSTPRRARS